MGRILQLRNYKSKVTTAIWKKGDDTCSKSAGGGRTYFYNPDKKRISKVTNDLRTHLGLPAYTKTDSDSKKKQVQRKQKNLSLKIQVNANQVTMNQKIAMKTKKHRLTTMNNKEAVLYGGRVLLLYYSQLKIRTFQLSFNIFKL